MSNRRGDKMDKRKINGSGCYDLTAFEAVERVSREERESNKRLKKLLATLRKECDKAGFSIQGHIVLKDKKTGKIWR